MNGGIIEIQPDWGPVPPHWIPYFVVEDVDDACERAGELGGKVVAPPMDVPAGRFATLADPTGAMFAVLQGEMED